MAFDVLLTHAVHVVIPLGQSVLYLLDSFHQSVAVCSKIREILVTMPVNLLLRFTLPMDFVVSQKSCSKEACLILFNPAVLQHTVPLLFHPHPTAPNMHTVHLTSCGTVWANLSHSDRKNSMFPLTLTLASLQSVILSFSFLSAILLEYNIHSIYFVHCYCSHCSVVSNSL